jgi:hypothetical protein
MFKNTEGHFSFEESSGDKYACTAFALSWLRSVEVASPSEQKPSLLKKNNGKMLTSYGILLYPRALQIPNCMTNAIFWDVMTRGTWRHMPEDGILHSHCRENLKA